MPLRVFELAKELNTPTKELIKRIERLGIKISGNFASLTDEQVAEIKKDFKKPDSQGDKADTIAAVDAPKVRRRIISAKKAAKPKETEVEVEEEVETAEANKETAKKTKKTIRKKSAKKEQIEVEKAETPAKAAKKKTSKSAKKKADVLEVAEEDAAPKKKKKSAADIIKLKDKKGKTEADEKEPKEKKAKKPKKTAKRETADIIQLKDKKEKGKKDKDKEEAKPKGKVAAKKVKKPKKKEVEVSAEEAAQLKEKEADDKVEEKETDVVRVKKPKKAPPVNKVETAKVRIVRRRDERPSEDAEDDTITTVRKVGPDEAELEKETDEDLKSKIDKKSAKESGKKEKFRVGRALSTDEVDDLYSEDLEFEKKRRIASKKRLSKAARRKERAKKQKKVVKKVKHTFNPRHKDITVGENITVGELAGLIGIKVPEIIKTLISLGIMASITESIDGETAALVAAEHNVEIKVAIESIEDAIENIEDDEESLEDRAPVVTIMGHVDHGKTSLLDKIRSTNITDSEAGGITQHIGAYRVKTEEGEITFLDTPGHEAFTAMRARGADITDIVILVVAADDGPRPQTVEAIDHAKAAEVEIIVAVNKCDKPDADPDKTIRQLMEHGMVSEEYGGDIPMIQVSAKTGDGIPKLLEMIQLQAEIMELRADPQRQAQGVVVESRVDTGKGNAATILIQKGTLRIGDCFVAGTEYGRIRAMWDDRGLAMVTADPSTPVEIVGLNGTPRAGDSFNVGTDEKQVRQIASIRAQKEKEQTYAQSQKPSLEHLLDSMGKEEKRELNLLIKTDVIGSLEALSDALLRLGNDEVSINIKRGAVGAITSDDVLLAATSEAIIIGFNTRPNPAAKNMAVDEDVEIRYYSVIYEIIDDVTKALEGMLEPIVREEVQGKAEVLEIFNIPKIGTVAGSRIVEGKFVSNSPVRVIRDNVIIFDGKLASLRRFKEIAKEVSSPLECGISLESFRDLKVGDELESYNRFETAAKLDG